MTQLMLAVLVCQGWAAFFHYSKKVALIFFRAVWQFS
jgi:hypothetical protein